MLLAANPERTAGLLLKEAPSKPVTGRLLEAALWKPKAGLLLEFAPSVTLLVFDMARLSCGNSIAQVHLRESKMFSSQ